MNWTWYASHKTNKQLYYSPLWVILTFVVIGVVFIPIGVWLKIQSDAVYEQIILYDSKSPDVNCSISVQNQGYINIKNNNATACMVTFTFDRDIPTETKVNVFYQLSNFYQNHRRYVKSRSDPQVGGKFVSDSSLETSCDPAGSFKAPNGLIYAPCGLIATSYFNDAFFATTFNGVDVSSTSVRLDESNIAWSTDMNVKFKNPTNPAGSTAANQPLNNWSKYLYLWQAYDQMSCYDNISKARVACQTWADIVGPGTFGEGCAKCNPGSSPRYEGGIAPPGGPQTFDATAGAPGNATAPFGFRDEHFVVWMRTAGLPQFRKLYGVLTPPANGFKKGDNVTFEIVTNFEVASFHGTKALILSTTTPTGGKSDVLGIAYLTVGSICIALALAFGIKHLVAPRKLGDPQYIVWRHAKQ